MNKSIFSKVIILAIVLTLCAVVILTAQSGTFFGLKKQELFPHETLLIGQYVEFRSLFSSR